MAEYTGISGGTRAAMIMTAAIIDLFQLILDWLLIGLLLAPFINVIAMLIFGIWFSHHNVRFLTGRRAWASWTTIFVEFVPGLNALPTWTPFVIYKTYTNPKREEEAAV